MLGCYGEAETTEITVDPTELDDAKWVSREEMQRAFDGDHPTMTAARKGAVARFLLENWLTNTLD